MGASAQFEQWRAAIDANDDALCETLPDTFVPDDVAHIVALYADADENRRWWAVRALATWGGPSEKDVLFQAMADRSADVRVAAALCVAQVVGRWASRQGRPAPDADVHGTEAESFIEDLLATLTRRLTDDLGFVRQAAADALAQVGEPAIPNLRVALQSGDESARTRAAYALRKMKSRPAAELLFLLINDPNPLIGTYAREGLDDMGLLGNLYFRP